MLPWSAGLLQPMQNLFYMINIQGGEPYIGDFLKIFLQCLFAFEHVFIMVSFKLDAQTELVTSMLYRWMPD